MAEAGGSFSGSEVLLFLFSGIQEICIYNLERMLIELVRFRGKLPFDYYKEIIGAYRNRTETMDIVKVEEYADKFTHSDKIMQIIDLEVL